MAAGELAGDWGFAENLAYATLLDEGYKLRLVGQDCGRGTFFHRHAILHDQATDDVLPAAAPAGAEPGIDVTIIDSLLSEEAVMAFEYGYSTADPMTLDIWEAQFGDFANGAQVVIDQFLSSGEAKWGRLCGLALFLPHGYEGQGPEHSSARLERFLQLCALDNMIVCAPTTPAQAFHMIRRQMRMATRKPLVVMTPKSLLRHKLAVSTLDELANGEFQHLIPDATADREEGQARRGLRAARSITTCSRKRRSRARRRRASCASSSCIRSRARNWRPSSSASPAPPKWSGARKSRRTRARGTRSATTCAPACSRARRCTTPVARARRRRPPATSPTHVAEQAQLVADALVNPLDGDARRRMTPYARTPSFARHSRTPAMAIEVKVPVLPESVSDATIATWHKKAGDAVKRDENLVDLETDKVVLEVPSPVDGVLKEIKFEAGATVTSQQVHRDHRGRRRRGRAGRRSARPSRPPAPRSAAATADAAGAAPRPPRRQARRRPAAPNCRRARASPPTKEGVDPSQVEGTGRKGAVTKEDIVNYASGKTAGVGGGARPEERVPMTRMRARIAERLMQSKNSIAMLTSFNEVNLGKVMAMRKELGEPFEKANGIKLGFMSFFAKAAANALQKYPVVNASVDGNDVIYHGYADISIAVSTDKGLVTPVLRNVERMSLRRHREAASPTTPRRRATASWRSRTCRAAPSPSPTAAPSAR